MNRASDVPPSVANSGLLFFPVTSDIDLDIILLKYPGLFKKDFALTSVVKEQLALSILLNTNDQYFFEANLLNYHLYVDH